MTKMILYERKCFEYKMHFKQKFGEILFKEIIYYTILVYFKTY